MENKNYVVCRDSIYVGKVVKSSRIYCYEIFGTKTKQLIIDSLKNYRSMLFVLDENKFSNDLLYKTPNYPVVNVTDDETFLKLKKNSIVIKDAFNLSLLLEYFNYEKNLTIEDIIKIRKTFFTGRFGMDNSILFGMKEFIPDSFKPNITDENERYELYKKSVNLGSERQFGSIPANKLPRELMGILDERGRRKNGFIFSDSFKPAKEEGLVKKLTKF